MFVPIYAQRYKINLCFSQDTCNYTTEDRNKIHKSLKAINKTVLSSIMKNFIPNRSIEYNDNRISKFIAQYGKCAVSEIELGINDWHCHLKNPYHRAKDDTFPNLVILYEMVHRLVHLKDNEKIKTLINVLNLTKKQKEKLNVLRIQCQNESI